MFTGTSALSHKACVTTVVAAMSGARESENTAPERCTCDEDGMLISVAEEDCDGELELEPNRVAPIVRRGKL